MFRGMRKSDGCARAYLRRVNRFEFLSVSPLRHDDRSMAGKICEVSKRSKKVQAGRNSYRTGRIDRRLEVGVEKFEIGMAEKKQTSLMKTTLTKPTKQQQKKKRGGDDSYWDA